MWSLAEKSLVTADLTASATRYRLLESVREFARQRLDEHGETEATAVRLASWYRDRLGPARRHQRTWTSEVGLELDNLRAVRSPRPASADPALGQELAFTIARATSTRSASRSREAIDELERHIELVGARHPRRRVTAHHARRPPPPVGGRGGGQGGLGRCRGRLLLEVGALPEWDDAAVQRTRGYLACRSGDYVTALDGRPPAPWPAS